MDLAPLLPLAGESKADPAIGSTLDPNLTLLARQGTTVHLPLVKGEAGRGSSHPIEPLGRKLG